MNLLDGKCYSALQNDPFPFSTFIGLFIKHQASNLNTLPRRRILRRLGIQKRRMPSPMRNARSPRHSLAPRVKALDEHGFFRPHVLLVVEAVGLTGRMS